MADSETTVAQKPVAWRFRSKEPCPGPANNWLYDEEEPGSGFKRAGYIIEPLYAHPAEERTISDSTTTLEERVARAICSASGDDPDQLWNVQSPEPRWRLFIDEARAAISHHAGGNDV
jgi:hypothetical protein